MTDKGPNKVDAKGELKHLLNIALAETKRALEIILKSIKAPIRHVTMSQNLSWKEIIVTFVVLTVSIKIILFIIRGFNFGTFLETFSSLIQSSVAYSIVVGATWLLLDRLKKKQNIKDLFECLLMAIIPANVLSMIFSIILQFSYRLLWLSFLIGFGIAFTLLFLFYLGLVYRFALEKKLAGLIALGAGLLLLLVNYSMGTISPRGHFLSPSLERELKDFNKHLEEIQGQYNQNNFNLP